ncbi:MAG: hypothetical protein R3Y28_08900 [Candidatus Gastranaerophilales bacterium]
MRETVHKAWQRKLEAFWDSNITLVEYCRINNLNIKTASKWKLRLRPETIKAPTRTRNKLLKTNTNEEQTHLEFIELQMAKNEAKSTVSGVTINFGELQITLTTDFNLSTLKKVLSLLEVK